MPDCQTIAQLQFLPHLCTHLVVIGKLIHFDRIRHHVDSSLCPRLFPENRFSGKLRARQADVRFFPEIFTHPLRHHPFDAAFCTRASGMGCRQGDFRTLRFRQINRRSTRHMPVHTGILGMLFQKAAPRCPIRDPIIDLKPRQSVNVSAKCFNLFVKISFF